MADFRQVLTTLTCEETSSLFSLQLTDESDTALPGSQLVSLTATLYLADDPTVILNNRNRQNVLNVNGGTLDLATGLFLLELTPADNALSSQRPSTEDHVLLLEWTWGVAGNRAGKKQITFPVANQAYVT